MRIHPAMVVLGGLAMVGLAGAEELPWGRLTRAVLQDDRYASAFNDSPDAFVRALSDREYAVLDADRLRIWMRAQIDRGAAASVCVIPSGVVPDTLAESPDASCLIRRYLDAGGRVVWIGDVPFFYQGKADGSRATWGNAGTLGVLGVGPGKWEQAGPARITEAGTAWGMTLPDATSRPATGEGVVALSAAPDGGACTWFKNFRADLPASGFLRYWGGSFEGSGRPQAVAELAALAEKGLPPAVSCMTRPAAEIPKDGLRILSADAGIFFRESGGVLAQAVTVTVLNAARPGPARAVAVCGDRRVTTEIPKLVLGRWTYEILVPAVDAPTTVGLEITAGDVVLRSSCEVKPARKWIVYLDPSVHTDIGYTDLQENVLKLHNENLDKALDACRDVPEFRWVLENAWQVENYAAARPERVKELLDRVREGRIGVGGLYLNIMTGICTTESLYRTGYCAAALRRRHGIPVRHALLTDVPSALGTLPTVLAGSGIRWFAQGINQTRGPYWMDNEKTPQPYWWVGPDGSRVLTWLSRNTYFQAEQVGLGAGYDAAAKRLTAYLMSYEQRGYPYDALLLYGAFVDNRPIDAKFAETAAEWNRRWTYPKIVIAPQGEFFAHMEEKYGDRIPALEGDNGTYWEDGAASSSQETKLHLRNQEDLVVAETLAALRTLRDPAAPYPAEALEKLWSEIQLYSEHTWGAHNSISQPDLPFVAAQWDYKRRYATEPAARLPGMVDEGLRALAAGVRTEGPAVVVFNPHGRPVTDVVSLPKPEGFDAPALRGPDGGLVPVQATADGRIVFVAKDVPGLGWAAYAPAAEKADAAPAATVGADRLENRWFRVVLDPASGAVASLVDKESGREWIDPGAPYKGNEYLYVSGGEGSRLIESQRTYPLPKLTVHRPQGAGIERGADGPVFTSLIARARAEKTPAISAEIRLYRDLRRIDIVNRITKEKTYAKEAVYFAFPFRAEKPEVVVGVPGGTVVPETGQLPGACRDWYCARSWVDVGSGGGKERIAFATPDLPLVCLDDIFRAQWRRSLDLTNGHVYVYAMNNYWHTNYLAGQGGDYEFRFSLAPRAAAGPGGAADRSAEIARAGSALGDPAANPLRATWVAHAGGGDLPATGAFVEVADPDVLVSALKRSEDGTAWILRLRNLAASAREVEVRFPRWTVRTAVQTNLVEEPQGDLKVASGRLRVPLPKRGPATVRLVMEEKAR